MACRISEVVEILADHESESGLVTSDELNLSERWMEAITEGASEPWLDNWLSAQLPFGFQLGDEESAEVLRRAQRVQEVSAQDEVSDSRQFSWTDETARLKLTAEFNRWLHFPAVEWTLSFTNVSDTDTPILEDIHSLHLHLKPSTENSTCVVHGANGGRSQRDDMMPFSIALNPENPYYKQISFDGDYPSSNTYLPFFNIETPDQRGVLFGIGWSGHWVTNVVNEGQELRVTAGIKGARFVLHPGETVRLPRMLALFWQGKRLHGHNMFRQLLHRHYVPLLSGEPQHPLASVNVCFTHHGYGAFLEDANEASVLALVEPFAKLGTELLIIDAGWYDCKGNWTQPLADWAYSPTKYPRGLQPIAEKLQAHGMDFGLWFASEGAWDTMPVSREHPEWTEAGGLQMRLPEVREWFCAKVDQLVTHEGMTCYRQDGAVPMPDEPEDRKGLYELQHFNGLYACWDEIMRRHPGIIMEGCCGGGRRIDLETLARFHWHQKSDRWYQTEEDQCSMYGANLFLPGGVLNLPTQATDDYGAWSSFAGQLCLGWHPMDDDFPMEQAKRQVERYKRIRELLSGDFYPLTSCSLEEPWIGYQFHRPDLEQGFALLFRRPAAVTVPIHPNATHSAHLRGLHPDLTYTLRFEKSAEELTLTGDAIAAGVNVIIEEAPGAEMIVYKSE